MGWRLNESRIPHMQEIKGRVELSAAYLPHKGLVFHRFSEKKNTQEVIGLIKQVRTAQPHTKLYVILDNHRMHTSKDLKEFVKQDGAIELVYTPKYASWLNAVEQVFATIQKWVLNNSSYQSVNEIVAMINRHLTSLCARLSELLKEKPFTFALKMVQMTNLKPT